MRELRDKGLSYRAIGREVGWTHYTVCRMLDPAVAERHRERKRSPEYRERELARRRERYATDAEFRERRLAVSRTQDQSLGSSRWLSKRRWSLGRQRADIIKQLEQAQLETKEIMHG